MWPGLTKNWCLAEAAAWLDLSVNYERIQPSQFRDWRIGQWLVLHVIKKQHGNCKWSLPFRGDFFANFSGCQVPAVRRPVFGLSICFPDESNNAITCTPHTKSYVMYIDAKSLHEEDAYSIIIYNPYNIQIGCIKCSKVPSVAPCFPRSWWCFLSLPPPMGIVTFRRLRSRCILGSKKISRRSHCYCRWKKSG